MLPRATESILTSLRGPQPTSKGEGERREAKIMSLSLLERGDVAYKKGDFAVARKRYEDALRTDPHGHIGSDRIAKLKGEASEKYNLALNMLKEKPQEARKLLEEARASLLSGELYYREADELINQLTPTKPRSESKIEQALEQPVQFSFVDTPIKDVVEFLKSKRLQGDP